jgi:hypothetical protein
MKRRFSMKRRFRMKRGFRKLLIGGVVFLALLGGAGGFYLARPPLVIVVDEAFLEIYGKKRANMRRYVLSASLLRRAVFAMVAQDADQEAIVFSVSAASKAPYMALFPERYLGGADRYAAAIEEAGLSGKTRTVVLDSGDGRGVSIGNAESLQLDRETDLYRAGMCAAILAKDGVVVVYYQGSLSEAHRAAFTEGLVAAGHTKDPVFSRSTDSVPQAEAGCAVLLSAINAKAFAEKKNIPIVLFSWLDPESTPNGVRVVFDDSPLAIAAQAVKSVPALAPGDAAEPALADEPSPVHASVSHVRILRRAGLGKDDMRALEAAAKAVRG